MDEKKPSTRVSTIKLDEATRARILAELGVEGNIDWVPDTVHITRVSAAALGALRPTLPNPWVVVMV
jgi:hypothetical protein